MLFTTHFYGNEISDYGKKNGYVDYRTLAKAFQGVLCNNIITSGEWEIENGSEEYFEDTNGIIYDYEEAQGRIEELENKLEELDEESDEYAEISEDISYLNDAHYNEIFQYYIIDENGAEILKRHTKEIVFYNYDLDLYVWGVTHYGTSWDYVLTDIPCEKSAE